MTSHFNWSAALQRQTRVALEQLPVTQDGRLHFKHATLGFAFATYDDLCKGCFILYGLQNDDQRRFECVDALLEAGWVID